MKKKIKLNNKKLSEIFEVARKTEKKIIIVDGCYYNEGVVLSVGFDSVTISETPEVVNRLKYANMCIKDMSQRAVSSFIDGKFNRAMMIGKIIHQWHKETIKLSSMVSVRRIRFKDITGFTI